MIWFNYNITSVTIPSTLGAFHVKAIDANYGLGGFADFYPYLESVTIENGLETIGDYAFMNCSALTSVTIPDSVKEIGGSAFQGCESLTSVVIPDSVISIDDAAFYGCSSLSTVTLPKDLTAIASHTFAECRNLANLTFPSKVSSIGKCAFWRCEKLTSLNLPSSLATVGDYAFYGCKEVTGVTFNSNASNIGKAAFANCPKLPAVTLPSTLSAIGEYAFGYAVVDDSFTTATLPESAANFSVISDFEITGSENSVASGYADENHLKFTATGVTTADKYDYVVSGNTVAITNYKGSEGTVRIPSAIENKTVTVIKGGAFNNCLSVTRIVVPAGITNIEPGAFDGCKNLSSMTVVAANETYQAADSVLYNKDKTKLIRYPEGMSQTSFTIPGGVTVIGEGAFRGCTALTALSLPDGVTEIESGACENMSNLEQISISKDVTKIGENAFAGCSKLRSVNYYGTSQEFEEIDIAQGNTSLTNAILVPQHTHQFSYTASGAAVTVTCTSAGCGYTTGKEYKAVIEAATKVYDGNALNAKVTKDDGFPQEITVGDITYTGREGTTYNGGTQAPVNAGKYTASVTVGDKTALVNFEITQPGGTDPESQSGGTNPSNPSADQGSQSGGTNPSNPAGTTSTDTGVVSKVDISNFAVSGISDKTYTGKAVTQSVVVSDGTVTAEVSVKYTNNVNVGTAVVIIEGTGNYTGTIVKTFKINKAAQTMTVKASAKNVKLANVKKKKQTVAKAVTVKNSKGKVTYTRVAKGSSKALTVNKTSGKITVKKGTKKGTYKIKIKVAAAGDANYRPAFRTVTVKIKVK